VGYWDALDPAGIAQVEGRSSLSREETPMPRPTGAPSFRVVGDEFWGNDALEWWKRRSGA